MSDLKNMDQKIEIESELEAWKNLKLNIGVMGARGDLKRLLINKLVGVSACDQRPDQPDTSHSHINNCNLVIWDLNASKREDLTRIDLNKFDLVILFRDKQVRGGDELVDEVEKKGKKCLIVTFDSPDKFDFSRLHLDILQALMLLTKDHFASYGMSIEPSSKEIINTKTNILRSRIEKGLNSALIGEGDAAKLASEIWFYPDQLGLSPDRLAKLAVTLNHELSELIRKSKFASIILVKDLNSLTSVLLKTLPVLIISNDALDIIRVLPAAESLLHGTISFASQKLALINILEEFSKVSHDLHSLADKTRSLTNQPNQQATNTKI